MPNNFEQLMLRVLVRPATGLLESTQPIGVVVVVVAVGVAASTGRYVAEFQYHTRSPTLKTRGCACSAALFASLTIKRRWQKVLCTSLSLNKFKTMKVQVMNACLHGQRFVYGTYKSAGICVFCMHACMHACLHVCMYVCMYVCVCIWM